MAKDRGKAFLIVGHKTWGKSSTLTVMTLGNYRAKYAQIKGEWVFVRKMSNDDYPVKYLKFMKAIKPAIRPWFIVAFCPTFHQTDELGATSILTILKEKYDLFFFVLKNAHKAGDGREIDQTEIDQMEAYGDVLVVKGKDKKEKRAQQFTDYIEGNV